jgi:ABC-2 type transport system permease protein
VTTLREQPASSTRPDAPRTLGRAAWFRPRVIAAIARRDFFRFFFNPAGYVFIALLVLASAGMAFWQHVFFTRNLDNLDTLNGLMPLLLLFFIPAVTMSIWADERKQGTEELLLTLPATDFDVVLGKYLAALGIYSVALGFMLPHVLMLLYLGQPDLGVTFATFVGYWLIGSMLLAVGMVASLLSSNVTVAFILGAALSALPVFAGVLGSPFWSTLQRQFDDLSVPSQFHDFGTGVIAFSGLFYFLSAAAAFLYVNMVLLGRRHWAGGEKSLGHWAHSLVRIAALIVALASLNVLVARAGVRWDLSEERLHTLSPESLALLKQIPKDRPVYIQAYYSPEVPREFVSTKSDLIGLLKEYAARGGDKVKLNLVETELYSSDARDAEKRFGIEPKRVLSNEEGRQAADEIVLGVAFSSGLEEVVIPFFDRGLPVEYELTRSIRVVTRSARKKVGILSTDAKLMGGFDMRSMGQNPEWSIVIELKKQYDVSSIAADSEIATDLDVLLVAQPSSLTQKQIDNLSAYVKRGGPTLLFLDPLPVENPSIAPEAPRTPPGGPFGGGPPPEPKGDLKPLLDMLGLDWPTTEIVWNPYNPLQQRPDLPPEVVFIGRGSGASDAFNEEDMVTSSLQEVVAIFPGLLRPKGGPGPEFTPLLRTNAEGGTLPWDKATRRGMFGGMTLSPERPHFTSGKAYTLAAHLKGDAPAESAKEKGKVEAKKPIHAIAIADLDLISEEFFELRRQKVENLELDNVTFVLNCVDVLAGDDAFVALRKRRLKHRTLTRIEAQTKQYIDQFQRKTKAAEDEARDQLAIAQKNLDKEVSSVRARKDLDERTKEIMLANLEAVANRRLEVQKANIEDTKRHTILESKAESEQNIRRIRNRVRWLAVLFEPLPPIALGLIVFGFRIHRENYGANPNRIA